MSELKHGNSLSSSDEEGHSTPDILISDSDQRFFQSLYEFIAHEKQYLQCPQDGADELRYNIHRTAFSKVIARSTTYKKLLLTIKGEYDDVIRELQRREGEARMVQRNLEASTSHPKSLLTCQRRAAELRKRISVLQSDTAELKEEIKRWKSSIEQSTWIPGLTVAESVDLEALDRQLKHFDAQRAALLDEKSHRVSLEIKAELDAELQAVERHRDQLQTKNNQLKILFVSNHLDTWEDKKLLPLEELLRSTLEDIGQLSITDNEACSIDTELFEDEEPTGVNESRFQADYLHRFTELFDSARYEEAALHAARSPRGFLRNLDIMEMFKGVKGPPPSAPPLLLFFEALLMTLSAGDKLSAALSLHFTHCALEHSATQLITHAVNTNKLTYCEDLGDILTEHAQKNRLMADRYLAFASVAYESCGLNRKVALSMCIRGLTHSAATFMKECKDFTADPEPGHAAILSVGVACSTLLADPQKPKLALQLLDGFVSRGQGVLEKVILEDSRSSVDIWTIVSSLCSKMNRADLSQAIRSVLLDQSGTRALSPDLEGAQMMEHIFL
ncbi:Clathrin heavy chain linker domain-containing protein 1 [Nibea albiflora]|uniref:Clathrin heavy chain linker domain-containing protein 1 n=1 Tax=Nibea albiflora TaxID=240163 RepID=A0ACB7EE24_NIBAL|nr:Clathrin heavy chain linker domain-containing protein 1 [Nibea albiflora]